jgi:hypothetical protein
LGRRETRCLLEDSVSGRLFGVTCVQVVASSAEQARKIAREAGMDVRHVEALGRRESKTDRGGSAKSLPRVSKRVLKGCRERAGKAITG